MPDKFEDFLKWAARQRRPVNDETMDAYVAAKSAAEGRPARHLRSVDAPATAEAGRSAPRDATAEVRAFLKSLNGPTSAASHPSGPAEPRRRPTSAIAMARPARAAEVLDWAVTTGRVDASERHGWANRLEADPELADEQLRGLPFRAWATDGYDKPPPARLFPQRAAAAGVSTAEAHDAIFDNIPPPAGPSPQPFVAGALPKVTASGADPKLLANLDLGDERRTAAARVNLAAAPSTATFAELYERYTGPHADAERIELDQPGAAEQWADYEARVTEWASTPDLGTGA